MWRSEIKMSRGMKILQLVNLNKDISQSAPNENHASSETTEKSLDGLDDKEKLSHLSPNPWIEIEYNFEEKNVEMETSQAPIILSTRKTKNWFCNRGFSPPEKNICSSIKIKENDVEQESTKETSLISDYNETNKENINTSRKIVVHEIMILKPAVCSSDTLKSVTNASIMNLKENNKMNNKQHFTYTLRNKQNVRKMFEESDILIPESPEDPFHDSESNDSLYCPSDDKDTSSDSSDTGLAGTISPNFQESSYSSSVLHLMKNKSDLLSIIPQKDSQNENVLNNRDILLCNEHVNDNKVDSLITAESAAFQENYENLNVFCNKKFMECENEMLNTVESIDIKKNIDVPHTKDLANFKKTYKRKPDYCYYCEAEVLNFGRHVLRNHCTEKDVSEILSKPVKSKERRELFNNLRRKGNFLGGGGNCFKAVRQTYVPERTLLPCDNCMGFFSSKLLYRHRKHCFKNKAPGGSAQAAGQSKMLTNLKIDRRLKEEVFPHMRADKISLEAKNDPLICAFGTRYLKTHREKHFVYVTSRKMRELSKILIEMRKLDTSITTMFSALQPKYFDLFVETTKSIAKYDPEKDVYHSPTFAMNIVTSLKQCCDIAITLAYKKQAPYVSVASATLEADLKTLIHLFQTNWSFDVSSHAASNLNLNKWNKVTIIPLASDLKLFRQHLIKIADEASKTLESHMTDIVQTKRGFDVYNTLTESVYCRTILLNRKRSGELQRMYVHTYLNSSINEKYEEFQKVISQAEKILLNSLKRVVIRGKRGRGVPVLFSSDVQKHIKILLDARDKFVPKSNPYLFAIANTPSNLIGYKILGKHAKLCGAKNPSSITSTRLRKHLATLSQLFTLSDGEIEQLATFMGHTPGVHRNSYRLPDDVYQTAKLSKLLMVMEKGGANKYKGKSLDEIDIDMEENLLDNNSDESDINEPENDLIIDHLEEPNSQLEVVPSTSSSDSTVSNIKGKKGRKLVPWTPEQKKVTIDFFENHIKHKKPPKKKECEVLKSQFTELLKNKDWLKIKVFIQNVYKKQ